MPEMRATSIRERRADRFKHDTRARGRIYDSDPSLVETIYWEPIALNHYPRESSRGKAEEHMTALSERVTNLYMLLDQFWE
ncbi:hypothetical protein Tco_0105719 [Tanacetum coccineum]